METIHTTRAITPKMRINAHHIPALKMVPMASQLLRNGIAANNKAEKKFLVIFLFLILLGNQTLTFNFQRLPFQGYFKGSKMVPVFKLMHFEAICL